VGPFDILSFSSRCPSLLFLWDENIFLKNDLPTKPKKEQEKKKRKTSEKKK